MSEFQTVNPSTSEKLSQYSYATPAEIDAALEKLESGARDAWSDDERRRKLRDLAAALRTEAISLANQIALEMGKPVKDGIAEIEKSAGAADYYAERLGEFAKPMDVQTEKANYRILAEATGNIFAVMPWNFPVWQIMRVFAPALALGNRVVLKHSDSVAGSAKLFTEIVQSVCGERVFQNLRVNHDQAAGIIADRRVQAVTMTGSSRGGREIAAVAGKNLKKVVLELGGSDAYIVFESADVAKAAALCAQGRLTNNGQSCVSAKRFVVHESVWEDFQKGFRENLAKGVVGDPTRKETELGPLAQMKFKEGLEKQTQSLAKEGGERLFKREIQPPAGFEKGAFFGAEIWSVNGREKIVREEEFFGPVALTMKFKDEREALELANLSVYGLGGGVFSEDRDQLNRVAARMRCGFVALNDFVRSDPRVPFGGVKDSGFGRELGPQGFYEFAGFKTVARGSVL